MIFTYLPAEIITLNEGAVLKLDGYTYDIRANYGTNAYRFRCSSFCRTNCSAHVNLNRRHEITSMSTNHNHNMQEQEDMMKRVVGTVPIEYPQVFNFNHTKMERRRNK